MKKCLFFGVSLMAGLLYSSMAYSNECCGWRGPISPHGDTGHIEISDLHTQGEHSLNFIVHYVEGDTLHPVYAEFSKYFGGIELPDSLKWDNKADTHHTAKYAWWTLIIVYQDTIWMRRYSIDAGVDWLTVCMDSGDFAEGRLVSPDTVPEHLPPHRIDSLRFRIGRYGPQYPPGNEYFKASIFIDNLRFYYGDNDTLVDGMGDETGIEEDFIFDKPFSIEILSNPFRNQVQITYDEVSDIGSLPSLSIYDITGRKVKTLSYRQPPIIWKGRDDKENRLPAGIYFLQVKTEKKSFTKKLIKL